MLNRTKIILVSALFVASCASTKAPDIRTNNPVPVQPPKVAAMTLSDVQWQVYRLEDLKRLVAEMESKGQTTAVVYVLTDDGFQTLAANLSEMKRYISDQKGALDFMAKANEVNGQSPQALAASPVAPKTEKKKRFGFLPF